MKSNLRILWLIGFSSLVYTGIYAQPNNRRYGIKDKESGLALSFYSVKILEQQKILLTATSNREGYFYIDTSLLKNHTNLLISIGFLGSKKFDGMFDMRRDSVFFLETSTLALQEVTIAAKRKLLTIDNNKITYDLAHDSLNSKSDLANAMRQLPGVDVTLQGGITVGDKKILYMLNGQEDALVNGGKGLNALPARYISKIELITDPDPRYREQGYDLVINIISKADLIEGYLGSLGADFNSRGAPGANMRFYYRKNSFAVNINSSMATDKASFSEVTNALQTSSQQTLSSTSSYTGRNYNNSLELNWSLNKALVFTYVNYNPSTYAQTMESSLLGSNVAFENIANSTTRNNYTFNIGAGIRFSQLSKNTTGSVLMSFSNAPVNSVVRSEVATKDSINLASSNAGTRQTIIQGSFTTKLNNRFSFDYGLQGIHRNFYSYNLTSYINSKSNTPVYNETNDYQQDVEALFFYLKVNPGKNLQFNFGARAEYSMLSSSLNASNLFGTTYFNILPRVNFSSKVGKNQSVELSYHVNLKRPSPYYVTPFINSANSVLSTTGNPGLQPEIFQIINLSYSLFLPKNFYLRPELYTSFSGNSIQRVALPSGNGFLYTYENGGKSNSKIFYLGLGGPISKRIQFNASGGLGENNVQLNALNFTNTFYTLSITNTYTFNNGFRGQIAAFFNSPVAQPQGYMTGSNSYSVRLSKAFDNDRSTLSLTVQNPLTENRDIKNLINDASYSISSIQSTPVRILSLSYFYRFGKLNEKYVNRGSRTSVDDLKPSN